MTTNHRTLVFAILFVCTLAPLAPSRSQTIDPGLLRQSWKARWIAPFDGPQRDFGVFHFRKTFSLASVPQRFVIHVSGDNRYELYVNGARVLNGPARGDLFHWRFETLDIGPHLHVGKNVLAAVVWNFAEQAPMAQMTNETGFTLQGDGEEEQVANTNHSWKWYQNTALEMIPQDLQKVPGYFVAGPGERWDGTKFPWGWEQEDFDDSRWKAARELDPGSLRGARDSRSRWMLVPRPIPLMEEKLERLVRVVRSQGAVASDDFLAGRAALTVPASARATILLDQTKLTCAYPELIVSGGRGAEITLAYAEALVTPGRQKGNRNETEGKEMRGFEDVFLPDGGAHRLFRPLWWRTFRYLQINVQNGPDPLTLEDVRGLFTAYPFTPRASFESDDPELAKIWQVGWRTARLCAHETYMDCPYYEQLQYGGDARIQALISLYMTGDDRLVKNAIESLDESRTPEGLTQSRYPSHLPNYIPEFSLFWIGMLHDYWWYGGDPEYVRPYLQGTRGVLAWFESRLSPSGLLGPLQWWSFVDWVPGWQGGVPPLDPDGQSSILSLQFAAALREAAELESAMGVREHAEHYRALRVRIIDAVRHTCLSPTRRLVADTPAKKNFSQHANVLAVLEDVIPPADQQWVMETVLSDSALSQASYYFRFYLHRALKKAGLADEYIQQLGPWRKMLALGLTTWAEEFEPTRSDCHAYSAHPNFDLLATVAGIEPAAPGFREVVIEPHLGPLRTLTATLPHPQGEITVSYRRAGDHLVADVTLPGKLRGRFAWQGRKVELRAGYQHLEF
ncbi:MAG: glycoside hydrolase family 78 protein [Acidobacteriia bacterium]|nr:glycoside hydrolase family 78 protein [Terriglobia bacterium]